MTKKVRVENADNSDHKLVVQTWQVAPDDQPHVLVKEEPLNYPTAMTEGLVFQGQYLVIKEV